MDKLKYVKLEQPDGSYSDAIPIVADANQIEVADGESIEVKLNKKPYYYNTVANMKADTKLKVGDMAITLGYYSINDGGNGEYQIISGNYTDDGGSIIKIAGNIYAKLIIKDGTINVKQYGAYGDNSHDDTTAIQKAINVCYDKKLYFSPGTYIISSSLNIIRPIVIDGVGSNGLSQFLGQGSTTLKFTGNGKCLNCTAAAYNFRAPYIKNIRITTTSVNDTTAIGIYFEKFNHFTLDNVTIDEFRKGIGVKVDSSSSPETQYSYINNCHIGMCLIGIQNNNSNALSITNCMIDGNNNGSDISQYTHGYPDGSIGIDCNGGGMSNVRDTRIQGFEIGCRVNSSDWVFDHVRHEMNGISYDIYGDRNVVTNSSATNYLLLAQNGLSSSQRYGNAVILREGANLNHIGDFLAFGSIFGIEDHGTNNTYSDHILLYLGDITASRNYQIYFSPFLKTFKGAIKSIKVKADNFADVKALGYGNRWMVAAYASYKETQNFDDATITDFQTCVSNNAQATAGFPLRFVKYGENTDNILKNVIVDIVVELYPQRIGGGIGLDS